MFFAIRFLCLRFIRAGFWLLGTKSTRADDPSRVIIRARVRVLYYNIIARVGMRARVRSICWPDWWRIVGPFDRSSGRANDETGDKLKKRQTGGCGGREQTGHSRA